MREFLEQLIGAVEGGREVCYCRLVETRGSTPQKAGAAMLVFASGAQFGTLGGGCVEAEVKRRALALLPAGRAEVLTFQLDNDYGWDDGLICGGRMQIVVDPLRPHERLDYFKALLGLANTGATEAIAFESRSADEPVPGALLCDAEGNLAAARPESAPAALFERVRAALKPLATRPRPYVERGVSYLPLLPRCRLLIVGGGHVGQALGKLAHELDFAVWVVDDRADAISAERFPQAERRIHGPIGEALRQVEITPSTYCVIVTRGHNHDEEALLRLIDRGAGYLGMIGSQRKIKLIFSDLLNEGVPAASLAKVHAPLGIDIGSQTVPE
ncbi:MAG TPA: XdhC family protein, partial [Pirellulales bacterium]|nr:XdhC family protein [Pirellulales bacterium]